MNSDQLQAEKETKVSQSDPIRPMPYCLSVLEAYDKAVIFLV